MKYHELNVKANKSTRRVGRGISAGQGKTAGRGTKGQGARTGSSRKPGFAGGQTPLMQTIPKLGGFRAIKAKAENVYTGQLNQMKATVIDNFEVYKAGYVSNPYVKVKVIVNGELTKKLTVKLQSASETAIAAIKTAGGNFEPTLQVGRVAKKPAKEDK